jgi:hypothetical protein
LGVTSGARVDEVGSGRQRSSPSAGRHRRLGRAGSALRTYSSGTVPRTTRIRGLDKGTPSQKLIRPSSGRDTHSRRVSRPSSARAGGTLTISSDIHWSRCCLLTRWRYQLSKRLHQEDKATFVRCGSDPLARSILLRSRNRIGFPICCNNDAKNVSGERVICCAKWY